MTSNKELQRGKRWLHLAAAASAGIILGMLLISVPYKSQLNTWKEIAGDWQKQALECKDASGKSAQDNASNRAAAVSEG
ncbi:hypothetical protein H8F21_14110 [Pseudomonas sp. P66]|uniref:YtxH domain-containing protein n=1 Tax=Pseudomonas arcuscaelestis TaxID=2710591 RepID=A0ABS2BYK7_9PSED|nr:hypothetical protein [Pseudomonas arcuscaelestis]MBM5458699.1 hypothetical protein [Pseudomonas arcuscaelestis]